MKNMKAFVLLLTVVSMFGHLNVYSAPTKVVKLDKDKFIQGVKAGFDGKVKGYQAALVKGGQMFAEVADGEARTKVDAKADMTLNTPSNIGSTAKFFAGVALLKLFASPKGYLNPSGTSVDGWLNKEIFPYLPEIWKNTAHPSWKNVTFRELLQHKSGIRGFTQAELDAYKAKGITLTPYHYFLKPIDPKFKGVREYQNFNFTILTFLIPVIADPTLRATINLEVAKKNIKADALYIRQRLGDSFEGYMRNKVFEKMSPKIYPSCDAQNEYPKQNRVFAMAYNSVADTSKGFQWSERTEHGSCYAQGGWYVSVRELAAFAGHFGGTETLVPNDVKAKMFDSANEDDRLVWSTLYTSAWFGEKFGISRLPAMDGLQDGSRSVLIKLPQNYFALAIVNSGDMQPWELAKVMLESFKASASF